MSDTKTRNLRTISPSELAKILKAHRLWRETNGVQGNRANLRSANLQGADLRYANLYGADLRYANLYGADLQGAKVSAPWKILDGKLMRMDEEVAAAETDKGTVATNSSNQLVAFNEMVVSFRKLPREARQEAVAALQAMIDT